MATTLRLALPGYSRTTLGKISLGKASQSGDSAGNEQINGSRSQHSLRLVMYAVGGRGCEKSSVHHTLFFVVWGRVCGKAQERASLRVFVTGCTVAAVR